VVAKWVIGTGPLPPANAGGSCGRHVGWRSWQRGRGGRILALNSAAASSLLATASSRWIYHRVNSPATAPSRWIPSPDELLRDRIVALNFRRCYEPAEVPRSGQYSSEEL
jgi:hypothetical protein